MLRSKHVLKLNTVFTVYVLVFHYPIKCSAKLSLWAPRTVDFPYISLPRILHFEVNKLRIRSSVCCYSR